MSTENKPWWHYRRRVAGLLAAGGMVLFLGSLRWFTFPNTRYFWPRSADDWSAWGTCLGAVGTIIAVIYAARTLKSTSEAQLEERRDRRLEMDFMEAKAAAAANKLRPNVKGLPRDADEYGPTAEAKGGLILVDNYSDQSFREVQVFVPDESLSKETSLSYFRFWEADLVDSADSGLQRGEWEEIEPPAPVLPGVNMFTLGTVPPRKSRSVSFHFSSAWSEWMLDWDDKSYDAEDDFGRRILLGVLFVDHNGKTWQRTSRDGGKISRVRSFLP